MPFTKQEVKEGLENSSNIKEIHNWYPEKDQIIFEPIGYKDKEFSIKTETLNSIHGMGWEIKSFYDDFVEIEKREKSNAEKKIEEIKDIV
jgi:hypothetical protein